MKKLTFFIGVTMVILSLCQAQIAEPSGDLLFEDTISFDPLNEWITIPSPDANIWQIGFAQKSFFDDSLSPKAVMITDTMNSYPTLVDNYFLLSIPSTDNFFTWPEGILSFYHKFQTDSLLDGGFIEISYDGGESWKNILFDIHHINSNFIGLYTEEDTIVGKIPAFTGTSSEWRYTEFHWIWIALLKSTNTEIESIPILRFRFVSDDIDNGKDGWLIDQLVFRGYAISGDIDKHSQINPRIFPNPCSGVLQIKCFEKNGNSYFELYGIDGKLIIKENLTERNDINISRLSNGMYFYTIRCDKQIIDTGKLIKE